MDSRTDNDTNIDKCAVCGVWCVVCGVRGRPNTCVGVQVVTNGWWLDENGR